MQKQIKIVKCENKKEKTHPINNIIEIEKRKKQENTYYEESMNALIHYMKNHDKNPNEKCWNQYAINKKYLSSKTMGYLSEWDLILFVDKKEKN